MDQQENYRKSGFSFAYRTLRYAGNRVAAPIADPAAAGLVEVGQDIDLVREGRVRGYGVIRPARDGHRIGPLLADSAADAAVLFDALAASAGAAGVMLDVPEPNQAALSLAKARGLAEVFETARMYTGQVRPLSYEKVFAVTTLELG